jgi:hypothetical protein
VKYFNFQYAGKAIVAGLTALIGGLLLVITGNEGFGDVSVAEWLLVAGTVLGSYGVTYAAPANRGPVNNDGKHEKLG